MQRPLYSPYGERIPSPNNFPLIVAFDRTGLAYPGRNMSSADERAGCENGTEHRFPEGVRSKS